MVVKDYDRLAEEMGELISDVKLLRASNDRLKGECQKWKKRVVQRNKFWGKQTSLREEGCAQKGAKIKELIESIDILGKNRDTFYDQFIGVEENKNENCNAQSMGTVDSLKKYNEYLLGVLDMLQDKYDDEKESNKELLDRIGELKEELIYTRGVVQETEDEILYMRRELKKVKGHAKNLKMVLDRVC